MSLEEKITKVVSAGYRKFNVDNGFKVSEL